LIANCYSKFSVTVTYPIYSSESLHTLRSRPQSDRAALFQLETGLDWSEESTWKPLNIKQADRQF